MEVAKTLSLKELLTSGEYHIIPNVPIFDEHEEYDAEGNLIRRFGRDDLKAICDTTNARNDLGNITFLAPGHTIPRDPVTRMPVPEELQPSPVGYVANFKVGEFGPELKTGILADYLIHKKKLHRVTDPDTGKIDFPRPSIELRHKDKIIDWVAMLRKAPARELNLMAYSAESQEAVPYEPPLAYADADAAILIPAAQRGEKLFYAMEDDDTDRYNLGGAASGGKSENTSFKNEGHKHANQASYFAQRAVNHSGPTRFSPSDSSPGASEIARHAANASNIAYRASHSGLHDLAEPTHKHARELHIGAIKYQKRFAVPNAEAIRNHEDAIAHHGKAETYHAGLNEKDRFSVEDQMDPTKPADAMAPDEDFASKIDRYMSDKYPGLDRMHQEAAARYATEGDPGEVGAPAGAEVDPNQPAGEVIPGKEGNLPQDKKKPDTGVGTPSSTNTSIPGTEGKKKKKPEGDEDKEKLRMASDTEAIRYARLEEKFNALEAKAIAADAASKKAKATQRIQALQYQGYTLDPAREVERYCALDETAWDKEDETIKRYYKQDSIGHIPMGGMFQGIGGDAPTEAIKGSLSREQSLKAASMASKTGISFDDAKAKVLASV